MPHLFKNGSKKIKTLICAVIMAALVFNTMALAVSAAAPAKYGTIVFTKENIQTADLRKASDITAAELREYLARFPQLADISEQLISVQSAYGVNAIFILAVIRLESGNGKSSLAVKKNNLGGITGKSGGKSIYRSFGSKSECVTYMAELLSKNYLDSGGKYYNGFTVRAVAKKYCASAAWSGTVEKIMLEIQFALNKIQSEKRNL